MASTNSGVDASLQTTEDGGLVQLLHAAIADGNLESAQLQLQQRADVNGVSASKTTTIWESRESNEREDAAAFAGAWSYSRFLA